MKMTTKKTKKPRGKQHDIRAATLVRLADAMEERIQVLSSVQPGQPSNNRVLVLQDLADIFRAAGKRERKLR